MTGFQKWGAWFALTVLAVVISVEYLDRPISRLANEALGRFDLVESFTNAPNLSRLITWFVLAAFVLRRFAMWGFSRFDVVLILSGASLLISGIVKQQLKYAFGRTWPKYTFPSFIREDVYGFNPFHGQFGFDAFPSGHVAAICALLAVLCRFYPRLKLLSLIGAVVFSAGLVIANYHFLSDVIAGAFVGVSSGLLVVFVWDTGTRCAFAAISVLGIKTHKQARQKQP
jgi:membrane-associated phospholipid phosphatase